MGGYGSGGWGWHRAKRETDGLLRLDVRWLARQGYRAPTTSTPSRRPSGSAELRVIAATIVLPSPTSIVTSAITVPRTSAVTFPGNWLRALTSIG